MSRGFIIFLTSLLIVLGARFSTYAPLPAEVFANCTSPVNENKLQGLWELDRINNYEAFNQALAEESGFMTTLQGYIYPFVLERSQLYRIEQCGTEVALTVNDLREWIVAKGTIEEADIQVDIQDFKTELKESFDEMMTDVKDALAIEEKPEIDKSLTFIRKADDLDLQAELTFFGEELKIFGSVNGKNFREKIFYDSGELVREIAFVDSDSGSTDFIYRRYP